VRPVALLDVLDRLGAREADRLLDRLDHRRSALGVRGVVLRGGAAGEELLELGGVGLVLGDVGVDRFRDVGFGRFKA
jgi:hypothetical protein